MPTATLNGTVIAEAPEEDVLRIEGNVYFPPASVRRELLEDRAWAYPNPYPTAFDRVGADFSGYVAFWKDVRVTD